MKSQRITGFVVAVLLILTLVWVFSDISDGFRTRSNRILLKDPGRVDRIIISDRFDSTALVKVNQEWLLFGVEEVNEVAVENLLFAAGRLQINSIVSRDSFTEPALSRSIRFMKGDRMILTYEILAGTDRTLVSSPGSDQLFMVSIPGYSDQPLDQVFSSSANHYREHLLIDLRPSEISTIKIELKGGEAFQFTQDEDGFIQCIPANPGALLPGANPDSIAMRLLFSYFTAIRFEEKAGISAQELKTGPWQENWLATIAVATHEGEQHTLRIYPYFEKEGEVPHMFKALVLHNDAPDAMLINYIYLDVLMRDLSHYFDR